MTTGVSIKSSFSSCKVIVCCIEKDYVSCAECDEYLWCKILNNQISRIFGFIFCSDRKVNLQAIREEGLEKWMEEIASSRRK